MLKTLLRVIALCALCLPTAPQYAQTLLQALENDPSAKNNVYRMHEIATEWAATRNADELKGWKPLLRKIELEISRVNPDGYYPDARTFAEAIREVQDLRARSAARSGSAWWPVGPFGPHEPRGSNMNPGVGRINCVAFHPTDTNTLYVGAPDGGIWKTTNHGQSWIPLGDQLPVPGVSAIAIHPNHPDTIFIATGDSEYMLGETTPGYGGSAGFERGMGVFKSTDGGLTWEQNLAMNPVTHDLSLLNSLIIHPDSTDWMLTSGPRGVWKSTNGGESWFKTDAAPIDVLAIDPQNPHIVFAGISNISLSNNYNDQPTILRSTNFGSSWQKLPVFTSDDLVRRIDIQVAPSDSNRVYAIAVNSQSGLFGIFRSDNGGDSWMQTLRGDSLNIMAWNSGNPNNDSGGQGWYDLVLCVDPNDPDRVFAGGVNLWGSEDGGNTWTIASHWTAWAGPSTHADLHELRTHPLTGKYYLSTDGGVVVADSIVPSIWSEIQPCINGGGGFIGGGCYDFPTEWRELSNGLAITQFYKIDVFPQNDAYIVGGTQDNSHFLLSNGQWSNVFRGDGMDCGFHPIDPQIVFGASQNGNLHVTFDGGQSFDWNITSEPRDSGAVGNWVTPFVGTRTLPFRIYAGFNQLWTLDEANGWQRISDFPSNIRAKTVALCPFNEDAIAVLNTGTTAASRELWLTKDHGQNWDKINTSTNLFSFTYPHDVCFGNSDNELYLALAGYTNNHRVYRTMDGGQSWENITKGFPKVPVISIAHHRGSANNTVYIGTDLGLFYTNDDLDEWLPYTDGLPVTRIADLELHYASNKIYAGTYGRGIWVNDLLPVTLVDTETPAIYQASLEVVPNPVKSNGVIRLSQLTPGDYTLQIIDVLGRPAQQLQINLQSQIEELPLPQNLPSGLYFLNLQQGKYSKTVKFVIE